MAGMAESVKCELCGRGLAVHESYVVRMDVFADPSMPPVSSEELAAADFDKTFSELLEQMQDMTTEELEDGVHRRFEFRLCPACHRRFLVNPMGKPRVIRDGQN